MRIYQIAIVAVAVSISAVPAFATSLTGSYSISEHYTSSQGGPSITYNLSDPFNINLSTGTPTSAMNFFTASPRSTCFGSGCSNHIETDLLTVTFSNLSILGVTIPTFTQTATFTAKYTGSELSCAVGDGRSPTSGETDCVVWTGASNTFDGSITLFKALGALNPALAGQSLEIFLYNATDWNITPKIAFELVSNQVQVPEPATFGLMGAGLAALALLRRRSKAPQLTSRRLPSPWLSGRKEARRVRPCKAVPMFQVDVRKS